MAEPWPNLPPHESPPLSQNPEACSILKTGENDSVHVILLGNYLPDRQESMQRYAQMLSELLTKAGHQIETVRPEPFFGRLRPSDRGLGKWLGYLDKFILFPARMRSHIRRRKQEGAVLVHICDHSNAMYTRWLEDVPHLVTCHDLLAIESARGLIPEHRTGWTGRVLQGWILSGLRRAAFVACVSDETRRGLIALAPELEKRSTTIENGLPYPFAPVPPDEARRRLAGLSSESGFNPEKDRFVLHVGGNQWYKNRPGVIRIFSRLCAPRPDLSQGLKLVMAGKAPDEELLRVVEEEKLAGKVVFTGTLTDEPLAALYSLAEALIFPSLREGFGWPIIEAQACGCPVVTSNRPPMAHVAGPAALLADANNLDEFAICVARILGETPENRHQRKEEARRHALQYDPQVFLKRILLVYSDLQNKLLF